MFLVPVIASFAVLCVYVCMCARICAWTACVLPRRKLMGGLCGLKSDCRKCTRRKAEKREDKGGGIGSDGEEWASGDKRQRYEK